MWPEITRLVGPRQALHRRFRPVPKTRHEGPGLYPGEPAACRRDTRQFLAVLAHLGLLLAVVRVYHLEALDAPAFPVLIALALVSLPVHYLLPYRWKKPFFVGVSAVGLVAAVGVAAAGWVLALGAVLIGTCYLPVRWIWRAGLVAAIALALGLARAGVLTIGLPATVLPVLGSLFMFRMIVYLYELKHADHPGNLSDTLGYFFLLPNLCFPLFPVVDYKTFLRGYFADDIHAIQRRGLRMMFWGTVHLLLYRVVDHKLAFPAEEVDGLARMASYLTWNYARYVHVSGQFHMACGMLHLFGFQLPSTHNNYLLATGFTDYWRRINIYWKDFMVRVVFNPVVFSLKRQPRWLALGAGTAVVFTTTWFLHAYQSFWLRGEWSFTVPDALFWGILGALVLMNVELDARTSCRRAASNFLGLPIRILKTAGTFVAVIVLWSLWTAPSVGSWVAMFRRAFGL
jgi:hypothetical protein